MIETRFVKLKMAEIDIHQYPQQYERTKRNLKHRKLSEKNIDLILLFDKYLTLDENLSIARRIRILGLLARIGEVFLKKDFDKVTKDDLKVVVFDIESNHLYSAWTKHLYKIVIRKFYKWLAYGDEAAREKKGQYPEIVSWINVQVKKSELPKIEVNDLLTEDEVKMMINAALSIRDKAFIALLYETGSRIGEIGNMQVKDVYEDGQGMHVYFRKSKTARRERLIILAIPYLSAWINSHPYKNDPEAPLWVKHGSKEPMMHATFLSLLKRTARHCGIKKRMYNHLFRHTRVTHLFMQGQINEQQAKVYFGWTPDSKVLGQYSHLISQDVDKSYKKIYGLASEKDVKPELMPKVCGKCKAINGFADKYCRKCGHRLDSDAGEGTSEAKAGTARQVSPMQAANTAGERGQVSDKVKTEALEILKKLAENPEIKGAIDALTK